MLDHSAALPESRKTGHTPSLSSVFSSVAQAAILIASWLEKASLLQDRPQD
jgi:hypothetical protein